MAENDKTGVVATGGGRPGEGAQQAQASGGRAQAVTTALTTTAKALQGRGKQALGTAMRFPRDRPLTTAAIVVAAVALAQPQVAAGAAVGMGAAALLARKSGRDTRAELASWVRKGRMALAGALERLEVAIAPERSRGATREIPTTPAG
jgi:hypothetical protein